jgi:hypothetical protein
MHNLLDGIACGLEISPVQFRNAMTSPRCPLASGQGPVADPFPSQPSSVKHTPL